uniref:Secreted protein n=1 Tax=Romanomermis culicivorax TaxID=13658 RepID=A0A915JNI9_ROMCU
MPKGAGHAVWPTAMVIYTWLFRRNGMQSRQRNRTEGMFSFCSVGGRFLQTCNYPFRRKVNFQAARFKQSAIRSVPSKKASINDLLTGGKHHLNV